MPRRFILGSGIGGLLAREILGDGWQLIPFGKSRFYSHSPPIADDFITRTDDTVKLLSNIGRSTDARHYQMAYSFCGELIFSDESFVKLEFIDKLFGQDEHPLAQRLLRSELVVHTTKASDLYGLLFEKFKTEILTSIEKFGVVDKIRDHCLKMQNGTFEYDHIISTIPLDVLYEYVGNNAVLPYKDCWYYHIKTPSLNFEGAQQVYVADKLFDFYKVNRISDNEYIFHCLRDLNEPLRYLGAFLKDKLEILNTTSLKKAIPVGAPPIVKLDDISPIGCHAQWDYFVDIASTIKRICKLQIG
jgi:hypothetical protein